MKIFILSDESWVGGASIANQKIQEELKNRGHEVVLHTINESENTWKGDMSADYYIVANWAYIPKKDLEKLFYEKPVMKFFHDIPGYMYHPKSVRYVDAYRFMEYMIDRADSLFFISPLQVEIYSRFVNLNSDEIKKKLNVWPSPKDMSGFENKNTGRKKNSCLYLGDISQARGIIESVQIANDNNLKLDFVGPFVDPKLVDKLKEGGFSVKEEIPNDEVADLMNQYEYFIYLPNIVDSFCFKIVEAELCGCNIISDEYRIGRYGYNESAEDLKERIEKSDKIIADIIEKGFNNGKTNK